MGRHILLELSVAVLVVLGFAQCSEYQNDGTTYLDAAPYRSNLAYDFFQEAGQFAKYSREYNDDLCDSHLEKISQGITDHYQWALEWPDSWGRMPMGLFWGHTISMGAFEECIAATKKFTETDTVRGKYCLAKIPIAEYFHLLKSNDDDAQVERISYKQKNPDFFELGVCIPKSCSAEKGDAYLRDVLEKYSVNTTSMANHTLVTEYWCKTDDPIELRGIDIFAIVFFACIIAFMILSSIYDAVQQKKGQKGRPLLTAFSVYTNAPRIFTIKQTNNPNVISCLNGLRSISMMWVVFGHGYMTFYELPHINRNKFYTWAQTPYSMLVQNATLCVDTFFFMSGLLMLWGAFRELEKTKGKLNIPMMYFHRYIRLTPVVAVVILYIMSLYKYSGHGPMWMKIGIQDQKCSGTWWATLLYVQNYVYPYQICVSQSWYLAVDTQLYFLSPLFLIPLWKWGKKALGPIIIFGLLCMGCTFATFMHEKFTIFRVQDDHVDRRQALTYYPTHTRVPTWLIGVIFGYFLFKFNRGKQIPMNTGLVICGWIVAFGTMLACLWGPYWRILPDTPDSPLVEGALYEPLSRASWACAVGWIVWACYNGHGGIINDFLSWGFFQGLARLSYCMYVIHRIVQHVNGGRTQHDTFYGNYEAILMWWHDFGIALTASVFATLAFEAPILGIEKAIFGGGSPPPKKKPEILTSVETAQPAVANIEPVENKPVEIKPAEIKPAETQPEEAVKS